jgi:hypothetical protein
LSEVNDKVFLERNNHILETATQIICVIVSKRIGNNRQAYQLFSYLLDVRAQLRPILTGE